MQRVVMVACATLLMVPVAMKSRMNQDLPDRAAFRILSSGRTLVKVGGAVRHPGVYDISANTLAIDVIRMAEPVRQCEEGNNGARLLQNGAAVSLAVLSDDSCLVTVAAMTTQECMVLGIPLDITAMSEADFDRLPGIGPALAKRVVEYRQKNGGVLRFVDLAAVEGIGEKKLEVLKKYFQHAENKR